MSASKRFIVHQHAVIQALGGMAAMAVRQRLGRGPSSPVATPGPLLTQTVPPRSPGLVRAYVQSMGGDPDRHRRVLPAHLFPQWGFPLLASTLRDFPYPILRVLNAGCRIDQRAPLSLHEPLHLSAQLVDVDDNGSRVLLTQRLVTGTDSEPEALVAHVRAIVPLRGGKKSNTANKKERPSVPEGVREIGWLRLGPNAGLDFACLTGDFNPVHWIRPYARAAGFQGTILHGFATLGRAIECMNRSLWGGDIRALSNIEVRFARPLALPRDVGVYVQSSANGGSSERCVYVGDAPGGSAYLTGTYVGRQPG